MLCISLYIITLKLNCAAWYMYSQCVFCFCDPMESKSIQSCYRTIKEQKATDLLLKCYSNKLKSHFSYWKSIKKLYNKIYFSLIKLHTKINFAVHHIQFLLKILFFFFWQHKVNALVIHSCSICQETWVSLQCISARVLLLKQCKP